MPFENIEQVVRQSLFLFILLLEIYGGFIIVFASNRYFFSYLRTTRDGTEKRLNLASHLAFGLEYLLAAEIIRTIVVRDWLEIQILAAVLAIRAALSLLIIWELKHS